MNASKLLQLQTAAAHMPQRQAMESKPFDEHHQTCPSPSHDSRNDRCWSESSSITSTDADMISPSPITPSSACSSDSALLDMVRCNRCHRASSLTAPGSPLDIMVKVGYNSYYCNRCAIIVGFKR